MYKLPPSLRKSPTSHLNLTHPQTDVSSWMFPNFPYGSDEGQSPHSQNPGMGKVLPWLPRPSEGARSTRRQRGAWLPSGRHLGQSLSNQEGLKTLPSVPSLSLSTYLEVCGSAVYGQLVFRSDSSPRATQWSSNILTSRAFSLDPAPSFAQSVIPAHLRTSFSVAWDFLHLQTPWPLATGHLRPAFR